MTEKLPSPENQELRNRLIELLRTKGMEDPETRDIAIRWREPKEKEARSASKGREGEIGLLCDVADVYREAGLIEEARAELEDAKQMAYYEAEAARDEATYNKFVGLFDDIERLVKELG
ncbi:MAG: hypothetical protein V1489_02005 [Candidatus Liptonbacteria bacterium]